MSAMDHDRQQMMTLEAFSRVLEYTHHQIESEGQRVSLNAALTATAMTLGKLIAKLPNEAIRRAVLSSIGEVVVLAMKVALDAGVDPAALEEKGH